VVDYFVMPFSLMDNVVSMKREGQDYYYLTDVMGSVFQVVDGDGNLVNSYDYNAWGEIRESQTTETVANPFLWQTKPWDEEMGLYYSRARYYEAGSGRFVGVDPLQSGHRYAWPGDSPILLTDSTGLMTTIAGNDFQWWKDFGSNFVHNMGGTLGSIFKPRPTSQRYKDCVENCKDSCLYDPAVALAGAAGTVLSSVLAYLASHGFSTVTAWDLTMSPYGVNAAGELTWELSFSPAAIEASSFLTALASALGVLSSGVAGYQIGLEAFCPLICADDPCAF